MEMNKSIDFNVKGLRRSPVYSKKERSMQQSIRNILILPVTDSNIATGAESMVNLEMENEMNSISNSVSRCQIMHKEQSISPLYDRNKDGDYSF